MADREQPYDPYIPSGQSGSSAGRDGNQRTAALQAVRQIPNISRCRYMEHWAEAMGPLLVPASSQYPERKLSDIHREHLPGMRNAPMSLSQAPAMALNAPASKLPATRATDYGRT